MGTFLLKRLATFVPTVLLVTILVFALQLLIPGGPAEAIAGAGTSAESIAQINHDLGLDRPLVTRYFSWLGDVFRGQLGVSYFSREPVINILTRRLEPTALMVTASLILAIVIGGGIGIWAAVRRRNLDGQLIFAASGIGLAVPDFWLATLAAGFLGLKLALFPAVGYTDLATSPWQAFRSLVLPVLVLSLATGALICRHVRSAMTQALDSTHIRTSWAMGLRPRQVYFGDALRTAAPAIITLVPLLVATLVGATVVVENVFAIPGLGSATVEAVNNRDYSTLQGAVLVMALLVIVLNLLADVALALLDRRVTVR